MAEGRGDSFGEALINAIAAEAGGIGRKSTYDRQGWAAQLRQLVGTGAGYEALNRAGVSATRRTLTAWLAETQEPRKETREKIQRAYDQMAAKWPQQVEHRKFSITGNVRTGSDERYRGGGNEAAFHVEGDGGSWQRMRDAWNRGEVDADDFEEWFVEDVIYEDIGEGSDGWEFPGGAGGYVVSI